MIIDISRWQLAPNFDLVATAVDYCIMRCTMGATGKDIQFARNWSETRRVGIRRRAPYHYQVTDATGPDQLENIKRVTNLDFGNAPFVVDCERTRAERDAMKAGWVFPRAKYTGQLGTVCYGLKDLGATVWIYSNKSEWETITTKPGWAAEFGFHVAAYPNDPNSTTYKPLVPSPWKDWTMWQYTSKGQVPGISTDVDLNRIKVQSTGIEDLLDGIKIRTSNIRGAL